MGSRVRLTPNGLVVSCLHSLISACSASGEGRVSAVMQPMDLTLLTAAARGAWPR